MEPASNTLGELLNEIKNELTDQISFGKKYRSDSGYKKTPSPDKSPKTISYKHLKLHKKTSQCCKNSL